MSDIHAAIGLSQLKRYDDMLKNRKNIVNIYNSVLSASKKVMLPVFKDDEAESSYHLYLLRIKDYEEADRDLLIEKMAELGIVLNVHYLPLPFHNAYKDYVDNNYINAFNLYKNEVTLPLYSTLKEEDALYIAKNIFRYLESN